MEQLTRSEQRVYSFLCEYISEHGFSPSVREIGQALGFASSSTVHLYLSRLETKGYAERERNKSRSYRPVRLQSGIKLLGRVHAGAPVGVEEQTEETFDIGDALPFPDKELFALRVVGDSMVDAGIFEGDVAIIHKQTEISDGDIAVAMVDGEVTVKTFYRENGRVRLQPENRSMRPIIVKDVEILGKVVSIIRKYD